MGGWRKVGEWMGGWRKVGEWMQARVKLTVGTILPTVLGHPPRGVIRWVGSEHSDRALAPGGIGKILIFINFLVHLEAY